MSLTTYKRKRNFRLTSEPTGKATRKKSGYQYVIQKHAATRLHYDLRLELEGTLKSWAVPKGPSFNPEDKRLAVHVEDHPLEYGSFEGTIPKGEYGGGTVMLWDRGTWESIDPDPAKSYKSGKMKFRVNGEKLHGAWALIRMKPRDGEKGDNWLLFKERDEFAEQARDVTSELPDSVSSGRTMDEITEDAPAHTRKRNGKSVVPVSDRAKTKPAKLDVTHIAHAVRSSMPKTIRPQLCTLTDTVPSGDEWLHEVKYDGYRIVAFIEKGSVRLLSRNGKDWTKKFAPIAKACGDIPHSCVLDGEVVALRENGQSDFQTLQNRLSGGETAPIVYYAFDLLYIDGFNLEKTSLTDRKTLLARVISAPSVDCLIRYSDHIQGNGAKVFKNSCKLGLEGVVSKQADAPYVQKRSRSWLKTKCIKSQEFVIGGYTEPGGSRSEFGALLLGYNEDGELKYAGRVGTGFTEQSLRDVSKRLRAHAQKSPPFASPPNGAQARGVHWLKPELVCEVEFTEWTNDGQLRHPSFKGLRIDKSAESIVKERPRHVMKSRERANAGKTTAASPAKVKTNSKSTPGNIVIGGAKVSHPTKELYPEGITKEMFVKYYDLVAPRMLPYISGRPLSLFRCPDGRSKQCFFQKNMTVGVPPHVQTVPIRESKGTTNYCVVKNKTGLLELANLGVLEFHIWGARADKVDSPDLLAFDLDPGPGVPLSDLVAAAFRLRDNLSAVGLTSFVKTTGGKGFHVIVPLVRRHSWQEIKDFSHAMALHMVDEEPKKFTANMSKAKRPGKIFIDYLRNTRGATFVAPYSTRALENATVSVPLRWDDLTPKTDPRGWTLSKLMNKGVPSDPWRNFFTVRQSISKRG